MKKVLLAASIASALCMANVAQAATGGTITFEGKITDQTCEVKINGTSADATVTLPTTPAGLLSGAGSVAGTTPFTLNLTNCNAVPPMSAAAAFGVQAYFEPNGTYVDAANHLLLNSGAASPAATNVDLQLLFPDQSTVVPVGDAIGSYAGKYRSVAATDVAATMKYFVQYKSLLGTATAGNVKSQVVYNLAYE